MTLAIVSRGSLDRSIFKNEKRHFTHTECSQNFEFIIWQLCQEEIMYPRKKINGSVYGKGSKKSRYICVTDSLCCTLQINTTL